MREFLDSERARIINELSAKELNRKQIDSIIEAEHPDGTLEDALSVYEQIIRDGGTRSSLLCWGDRTLEEGEALRRSII